MKEALTFNDVLIEPSFSSIKSRKDIDLSVKLGDIHLRLPILSANMDTVTAGKMASAMFVNGALGVLHRFWPVEDNVNEFVEIWDNFLETAVSVGLSEAEKVRAEALYAHGARIIVLDVANGAQQQVVDRYKWLKENLVKSFVIVGNFATAKSVSDFYEAMIKDGQPFWTELRDSKPYHEVYGLDAIKVGIGPGASCTTRVKTGVGYPQLSAIIDIVAELKERYNLPKMPLIIADGGLKNSGDIAKALAAGAHAVMIGNMLAGTDETPGEIINGYEYNGSMKDSHSLINTGPKYKQYRGSASKESYDAQGKDQSYITAEGEAFRVDCKGPVKAILKDIEGGLRSAFSYVGANNVEEFHAKAKFVRITNAGHQEGLPHGKGDK